MKVGDQVTATMTQFKSSHNPYECPFTGTIEEVKYSNHHECWIYLVKGAVELDIGPAARWGWFTEKELTLKQSVSDKPTRFPFRLR